MTGRTGSLETPREMQISAKKAVLFSIIIACTVILTLELGIRVWANYLRTTYEVYNSDLGRYELIPGYYQYPGGGGLGFRINAQGFVGPEIKKHKEPGVYRIFALGDSCTFGPYGYTYPGILSALLNADLPDKNIEVINAGVEGYNSFHALARLREDVLPYDPDLVVVYIGWNDLMKRHPEADTKGARRSNLAELLQESYLVRGYRKLLFYHLRPLVQRPEVDPNELDFRAFDEFVPVTYRRNIEAIIRLLQEKEVEIILTTRPTVLRRDMALDDLRRQNVFFPYYAGAYSLDKLLSLHRAYNRVVRDVADQYSIPLVDLDEVFNNREKERLFWDTMHPSRAGHRLIALSLRRLVERYVVGVSDTTLQSSLMADRTHR